MKTTFFKGRKWDIVFYSDFRNLAIPLGFEFDAGLTGISILGFHLALIRVRYDTRPECSAESDPEFCCQACGASMLPAGAVEGTYSDDFIEEAKAVIREDRRRFCGAECAQAFYQKEDKTTS